MSKSQKYINIVSILNVIGGAFRVLIGLLGSFGASIMGNAALIQKTGDASAPAAIQVFVVALIISGVFSLVCGILGLRAAKDAGKIKPVFILACIALVLALVGLIANAIGGQFSIVNLVSLVPPALMVFCANSVRNQSRA